MQTPGHPSGKNRCASAPRGLGGPVSVVSTGYCSTASIKLGFWEGRSGLIPAYALLGSGRGNGNTDCEHISRGVWTHSPLHGLTAREHILSIGFCENNPKCRVLKVCEGVCLCLRFGMVMERAFMRSCLGVSCWKQTSTQEQFPT